MHFGTHVAKFSLQGGSSATVKGLFVGVCLADWDPSESRSRTPESSGAGWAYSVRKGEYAHDGRTLPTAWSRSARSRWLARESITLTLNIGRGTLSVKADDVRSQAIKKIYDRTDLSEIDCL